MALFKDQKTTNLSVKGMHCPKCVARVTDALEALDGVTSVEVSLEDESATVVGGPDATAMVEAVNASGFTAAEA